MAKITITKKQAANYNRMLVTLRSISKEYQTPQQIRKNSEKEYGLDFDEAIEYAYENIQETAKQGCKGISPIT